MKYHFTLLFLFLFSLTLQAQDSLFSAPVKVREVPNPNWIEISGITASKDHSERLYIHNDSGGENAVFIMSTEGEELGKVILEGIENRDWEDIALGPGPKNKSYVYLAEIGDNLAQHEEIFIYRFPEPKKAKATVKAEKASYIYPNGPMDAEAIFVDPISERLYLISKRDSANTLFEMPISAFESGKTEELNQLGKFDFTSTVAADISQDGKQILVKTYFAVYHWDREEGDSVEETLARKPKQLIYTPEPQGEAVAFQKDGKGYFTLSEERFGIKPVLYQYKKQN
ncbi:hypothetical protein [Algoriphagus sediminis]|uniref:PE-PGRS family protein n=1 Tax=Algoriphagus sediminis TaxID=3057113 RepID=A0ABT7YHA6_9BACT|nr:hypothetical protein [Algoriphagus sediminis]MDN3205894.1 hypothetical protein [Algoriphagus sediminis]